jgi:hypothetical protein
MMNKSGVFLLMSLVALGACKTSSKLSQSSAGKPGCMSTVAAGVPNIEWVRHSDDVLYDKDNPVMLPKEHGVFSVDESQARAFFAHAKANTVEVAIPFPKDCKVFSMKESGTMSPELSKKFPGLVSLKGGEAQTGKADARLEWDGIKITGQVIWDDATYMVMPMPRNGKYYYVVYAKIDEPQPKPAPDNRMQILEFTK